MNPMHFLNLVGRSLLVVGLALACGATQAQKKDGLDAGLRIGTQANAQDLGLPLYPGATVQRDDSEDKGAVRIDLWGGLFGLKLAVGKFATSDSLEAVAAHYRRAMAAHGKVLECRATGQAPASTPSKKDKNSDEPVSCDASSGSTGELVLKVGTERNQRVVAMKPVGKGLHFQVVRIEVKRD
ncbi:MAG: hypothetical protein ACOVN9_00100 [Inhella sp.]